MEKRSRRRIRDLVARPASLGLSEIEIGCARISMMARNTNVPFKGRIQKRKTYHLQIITFRLQRAAGPYGIWISPSIAPDRMLAEMHNRIVEIAIVRVIPASTRERASAPLRFAPGSCPAQVRFVYF